MHRIADADGSAGKQLGSLIEHLEEEGVAITLSCITSTRTSWIFQSVNI